MLKVKTNSKEHNLLTDTDMAVQNTSVSGNGVTVTLYKSGHVVNAEFKKIGSMSKSGYNTNLVTIPVGYRPTIMQQIYYLGIAGSGRNGDGKYMVGTDGAVSMFTTTTGVIEHIVTGSWITSGGGN